MGDAADLRRRRIRFRRRKATGAGGAMSVMEHLAELRNRLIVSLVAFFVISVVCFVFYDLLFRFITTPLCNLPAELLPDRGCKLVFIKVYGGFLFRLKLTALAGLFFTSPVWIYEIWAFIVPGLTSREKKYVIPFVVSSLIFFLAGGAAAYMSLPTGLSILFQIGGGGVEPLLGAEEYLNFVGVMFLGFGATFQIPLVIFFLGLAGVISVAQLRAHRKTAVVAIVAISAVVTPSQDPYTMLVLAVPIYLLFEMTILLLAIVARRRAKAKAAPG